MPTSQEISTDRKAISAVSGTAPQEHVGDALGAEEGAAEIALGDVLHPGEVLHPERVAEAQLAHVVGALFVGKLGEALRPEDSDQGVARQDAHDHEHHDRHADHGQRPKHQSAGDVAIHLASNAASLRPSNPGH
jgi:hypothetical protein